MTKYSSRHRKAAIAMGVQGIEILGMWAGYICRGTFRDGLRTVENNMYLAVHLTAEVVMGLLLIVGGIGLLAQRSWGRAVGLVGIGSVIYGTVNSMADTIRNKPKLTPVLAVNCMLAILMAVQLARTLDDRDPE